MTEKNIINIALGVDNKYLSYAGILMTSIIMNSLGNKIVFHVAISEKLSDLNRKKIDLFNNLYKNAYIKTYDLEEKIKSLPDLSIYTDKRFNKAILLRIFIPQILPDNVKKLIYLDADMLCVGDIKQLWDIEIPDKYIIAASQYKKKHGIEQIDRLGLKSDKYFNSGVLLINMHLWKLGNITKLIEDCYVKFYEFFLLPDQDAINVILQNNIYDLPHKFNRMTAPNDPTIDLREKNDIILHFVNEAKPWLKGNTPVMDKLYKGYVYQSVWNDLEFLEPDTPELMLLAGRNYEEIGDYEKAAYYYGNSARDLMKIQLNINK
ncbi:glycosyltransferase family 8 protein [Pectinatus haikarae]|uniref:glycosyltransferase family 8 protein n=1 Tax=Pectinatus haikarae TaxID=349096 RepID=UPI0018C49DE3|nr:glycosyltransferase family 8 protein [Pectinatus haikarae]